MIPKLLHGGSFTDARGVLKFNNDFNALPVKRIYVIENQDTHIIRAWQGHQIEQRWFSVLQGSFEIKCIRIDNWESPSKNLESISFILDDKKMDILHLPNGYVSSIQALDKNAKLLVLSDYRLGEIKDEFRLEPDYFM